MRASVCRQCGGPTAQAKAIDHVWSNRERLFAELASTADVLSFCAALPFIGPITKYHLAKNLRGDFIKPDVHPVRLAVASPTSPWRLCRYLAKATGYREATVDTMLWRAFAERVIDSNMLVESGWKAASESIIALKSR